MRETIFKKYVTSKRSLRLDGFRDTPTASPPQRRYVVEDPGHSIAARFSPIRKPMEELLPEGRRFSAPERGGKFLAAKG